MCSPFYDNCSKARIQSVLDGVSNNVQFAHFVAEPIAKYLTGKKLISTCGRVNHKMTNKETWMTHIYRIVYIPGEMVIYIVGDRKKLHAICKFVD